MERLPVKDFLKQSKYKVILDVRSPGEYHHAHIPGAISFPLFTDEERKIVGTAYKQKSREEAIKIGLDFFGPKMRKMVEEAEKIVEGRKLAVNSKDANCKPQTADPVFIYCWRGGMRSAAVAWLLDVYGFKVHTLAGGYKKFRNHVLQSFEQPFQFKILGGFTGSGKTEILKKLKQQGETVIDLEKIASHQGSAFGGFKMPPQPTQEMFENLLAHELLKKIMTNDHCSIGESENSIRSSIWLEDESQRIGNLNIPSALWQNMRKSPIVFLEIPFEERLQYLVKEYGECTKENLIESTNRISKRLGGLNTKNAIDFFEKDNYTEAFRILLHYYDKFYLRGLNNRESLLTLLTRINCKTVSAENAKLLIQYQPA